MKKELLAIKDFLDESYLKYNTIIHNNISKMILINESILMFCSIEILQYFITSDATIIY